MTTLPTRFMASLRLRSTIVALALAATLASGVASGGTVQITDFTAGTSGGGSNINVYGGVWAWTPYQSGTAANSTRILDVTGNSSANYLAEEGIFPGKTITSGTALLLTADWTQDLSDGHFKIDLSNSGGLVASGTFTYGQFDVVPGLNTVTVPLTWNPTRGSDDVTQWYLIGNGANNFTPYGELRLTEMAVLTSSPSGVPEIDPAGIGSVLALATGTLGILERRRSNPRRRAG